MKRWRIFGTLCMYRYVNVTSIKVSILCSSDTFTFDIIQIYKVSRLVAIRCVRPIWRVEWSRKGIALDWPLYLGLRRERKRVESFEAAPLLPLAPFSGSTCLASSLGIFHAQFPHRTLSSPSPSSRSLSRSVYIPGRDIYIPSLVSCAMTGPLLRRHLSIRCRRYQTTANYSFASLRPDHR